ncbi:MAG: hypothetical protein HYY20_10335 [Candidatus Tectomicrobia bacterium]|uniref:Radical SAM core domain-containing protein n=1 Tax=Tectimicrobiota bacterium TaxID=2528274 RepID=A0A932CPS5_UNCTE|nr:hypothetical protein [Candidatus Tectomicrobia bacterium]
MMDTYPIKGQTISSLELKCELVVDGIRLHPSAQEGVGTQYKEQVHSLFDFDEDFHSDELFPAELSLSDGTMLLFKQVSSSKYLLRREDGELFLEREGERMAEVRYSPRPRFYDQLNAEGIPMSRVGQTVDNRCVTFCLSNYCDYFRTHDQCRFCNIVPTKGTYGAELVGRKRARQIAEVTAAAVEEGAANKFNLTGGVFPEHKEIDHYVEVMETVREAVNGNLVGANATIAAVDPRDARRLKAAGFTTAAMNLEVWDKNLFAGICPGKARTVGWQRWTERLEAAVEIFGKGNVRCVFVSGLESKSAFLEGADFLASRGIYVIAIPWNPGPGSMLQGHRSPTPAWHFDLQERLAEINDRHGFRIDCLRDSPFIFLLMCYDFWARHLFKVGRGVEVFPRPSLS